MNYLKMNSTRCVIKLIKMEIEKDYEKEETI